MRVDAVRGEPRVDVLRIEAKQTSPFDEGDSALLHQPADVALVDAEPLREGGKINQDEMLMTCPCPRGNSRCTASFDPYSTPSKLTSTILRVMASASSCNAPTGMIPALLTKTSSGPSSPSTVVRKASNEFRFVTSSSPKHVMPRS